MRPWRELESLHCCDRARVSRCAPAWAQPVGDGLWGFGYLHITALSLVCRSLHGLNESLIAQKHLSFQLLPRRRRLDAFGHKACVASLRDGSAFGELSEQPGYCQARGPSNQAHACPVTTPLPLIRFLDHARAHRIEHHVTCKFQQIRVAVYQKESKGIGSGLGKESGQAWERNRVRLGILHKYCNIPSLTPFTRMSRLSVAELTIMTPPPISSTTLPGLTSRGLQRQPGLSSPVGAASVLPTFSSSINTTDSGKSVAKCTTHTPRTSASVFLT